MIHHCLLIIAVKLKLSFTFQNFRSKSNHFKRFTMLFAAPKSKVVFKVYNQIHGFIYVEAWVVQFGHNLMPGSTRFAAFAIANYIWHNLIQLFDILQFLVAYFHFLITVGSFWIEADYCENHRILFVSQLFIHNFYCSTKVIF